VTEIAIPLGDGIKVEILQLDHDLFRGDQEPILYQGTGCQLVGNRVKEKAQGLSICAPGGGCQAESSHARVEHLHQAMDGQVGVAEYSVGLISDVKVYAPGQHRQQSLHLGQGLGGSQDELRPRLIPIGLDEAGGGQLVVVHPLGRLV
jgi:hypothetical protein